MSISSDISSNLYGLPQRVISAIRDVVGSGKFSLHEPNFLGNEWNYLKDCLDTGYVSSVGRYVNQFEGDLCNFTGAKHAIAVVNGTAALHIALYAAGVKQGDEVLLPPLTFVATANAVVYCGATPHFIDIEERTLGVSAPLLHDYLTRNAEMLNGFCINIKTGKRISALVPMHTFGHPVDMEGIAKIVKDFNLILIEDSAESIGSRYHGRHTGTFGRMGILSFNGNKTITTGGGGAILTDDSNLAKHLKHLTTTAKVENGWFLEHDQIGFNYRLPNINAALGCAQLEQLPSILESKRKLFLDYRSAFMEINGVKVMEEPEFCESNYWLQTLILDKELMFARDAILAATNNDGIATRPAWNLLHQLKPYLGCPRSSLDNAENIAKRIINIPSSSFIN